MIIDGEKYACEACVRGHRVSNCQHSERKLQHINKKGRPVSQCQHCRTARKSRAAHVKCDCGEKTSKCVHLQTSVEGHRDSCCCNHGGRCTCVHKKEQLDPVPESDSENEAETSKSRGAAATGIFRLRRRAQTLQTDGSNNMLAFDENGHHKPTYKHVKASQKCGPYQLDRVNSLHSTSSMGNRSVDNLLSCGDGSQAESSAGAASGSQDLRRVKSEATSPLMKTSTLSQLNGQLPPLDLSKIDCTQYIASSSEWFSNPLAEEAPMFSAGLSAASVDWSNFDLKTSAENFAPSSYSQSQSFGTCDPNGSEQLPSLTTNTSTSGEMSEVEDWLPSSFDDFNPGTSGFPDNTSGGIFDFSSIQASTVASTDMTSMDFMKASGKYLPTPSSLAREDPILAATTLAAGSTSPTMLDDEPSNFWSAANEYNGLPAYTESPSESNLPTYFGYQ